MQYIVIELQTNEDGTAGSLVYCYDTEQEAESKYHGILAAAAVSGVPYHAATMITSAGMPIKWQGYEHKEEDNAENN